MKITEQKILQLTIDYTVTEVYDEWDEVISYLNDRYGKGNYRFTGGCVTSNADNICRMKVDVLDNI